MTQRKKRIIAGAIGIVVLMALVTGWEIRSRKAPAATKPGRYTTAPQVVTLTPMIPATAPPDVQDAAARLRASRVGYAMVRPERTYLIISTGSDNVKVRFDKAEGLPPTGTPTAVTVRLSSQAVGERLLILASTLTRPAAFRFDLDSVAGAIPTLYNPDGLPLTTLPENTPYVAVSPAANQVITGWPVHVTGFARIANPQVSISVLDAKGRVLGKSYAVVAAVAPNWGSFVADIRLDGTNLSDSGFLVVESQTGSKLTIPLRFAPVRTPQLG